MAFTCETLDEFLNVYGGAIAKKVERSLAPIHTPGKDPLFDFTKFGRKPFEAQAHCITGAAKALTEEPAIFLIGQMGSGKTLMGMKAVHKHAVRRRWRNRPCRNEKIERTSYRCVVVCPTTLVKKWKREIEETIPGAIVTIIDGYMDVLGLVRIKETKPAGFEWFIIGRDTMKLSSSWRAATTKRQLELDPEFCAPIIRRCRKAKKAPPRWVEDHEARIAADRPWAKDQIRAAGLRCPSCGEVLLDRGDGEYRKPDYFEKARRQCENYVKRAEDYLPGGRPTRKCGEQLWQEVPKPRRYAPARIIHKKLKNFFDYFILDEAHEMKSDESVQAQAVGGIAAATRKRIALTGTLIGGYAWHVRSLLFRMGLGRSLIDQGFGWRDVVAFNKTYGRIETRIVEREGVDDDKAQEKRGHKSARGGQSSSRTSYVRPGIVPTLFGDHLVKNCIFLTLEEIADNLPAYDEDVIPVQLDPVHFAAYKRSEFELGEKIKEMVRNGDKRLLGTLLAVLMAYPDYPFDWGMVGYHGKHGFVPVTTPANLDPEMDYPKEMVILDQIDRERREGRQVWVYSPFTDKRDCLTRYAERAQARGHRTKILRADVPPEEREDWIARNGPDCDVIFSHPELVKTGLDFFDRQGTYNFCTLIFATLGFNLFTVMQAAARHWRIGQKRACRVLYYYYANTMQERAMLLMGQKSAAAAAVSGRFSSEGLTAMGGEDDNLEMAMAKSLANRDLVEGETLRAWAKLTTDLSPKFKPVDVAKINQLGDRMARLRALRSKAS